MCQWYTIRMIVCVLSLPGLKWKLDKILSYHNIILNIYYTSFLAASLRHNTTLNQSKESSSICIWENKWVCVHMVLHLYFHVQNKHITKELVCTYIICKQSTHIWYQACIHVVVPGRFLSLFNRITFKIAICAYYIYMHTYIVNPQQQCIWH